MASEHEKDRGSLEVLTAEYEGIERRLETLSESGKLTEYARQTIGEMTGKVLEHLAGAYDKVREGVKSVMEGKVLKYEAKTTLNEGILLGCSEGFALGEVRDSANTARNLLWMGLVPSPISEATGPSQDEIESLRQDLLHHRYNASRGVLVRQAVNLRSACVEAKKLRSFASTQ